VKHFIIIKGLGHSQTYINMMLWKCRFISIAKFYDELQLRCIEYQNTLSGTGGGGSGGATTDTSITAGSPGIAGGGGGGVGGTGV
jgi:hypothetical protein